MILEQIVSTIGDIILGIVSSDDSRRSKEKKKRDLIALCAFGIIVISVFAIFFWRLPK
jgi:hypothetical protein